MKYKNYIALIFIILFSVFFSCAKKYDREKLLNLYITENNSKFNNETSFFLLILRNFELSCSATKYGYNKDMALSYSLSKINKDIKIYVITDNKNSILKLSTSYSNYKNLFFIYESPMKMDQFGFYYSPYLFQIKNNKLNNWSKIDKYSKLPEN